VRAEERVVAGLEHERDVTAGVAAPDDDVAFLDGLYEHSGHAAQQRPRPARPVVVEPIGVVGAREEVAEGDEAGAVGRHRQPAR
jgi:hypothetical protein